MNIKIAKKYQLLGALFITAVVVLFVWRLDSPYPLSLDWDMYAHQHAFNAIKHGYFSLFPSRISDTFLLDTYLPTFALLMGGGRYIFGFLSDTGYYFLLDTIHFIVNVTLGALLGYAATKRYAVAFVSGLLAAFIYESVVAQTSLFFVPQNLSALIVITGLALWFMNSKRLGLGFLFSSVLIHFVIGGLGVVIATLLFLDANVTKKYHRSVAKLLPFVGIIAVIVAIVLALLGEYNPFSSQESSKLIFGFWVKLNYLFAWYSFLIVGYVVGAWRVFRSQKDNERFILGLSLGLLAAVILPVPYTLKFFTVGRFVVNVILAVGVVYLVDAFTHIFIRIVWYVVLWLILLNLFVHNVATFKSAFPYHGVITTVSQYELEAIDYIKQTYDNEYGSILMVSDPATQQVFEALTGVNSQGGAFATQKTRTIVSQTYPTPLRDSLLKLFIIKDGVISKQPQRILFIVSGRFIQWQNLAKEKKFDQTFNVWAPRDLTTRAFDYIDMLERTGAAKSVFMNKGVAVFEIVNP